VEQSAALKLGYALGLIAGEGSFTGTPQAQWLAVKLHADDPEPLRDLLEMFGGRIYGPYLHGGRHYRTWVLRGDELYDALPTIWRYLPESRKRRQLAEWAAKFGWRCRLKLATAEKGELRDP
jgi:hypothetical protein